MEEEAGFPQMRGFPSFPAAPVLPGARWTAPAQRSLDPLNQGDPFLIPLLIEYEYLGEDRYGQTPIHRVRARYGVRRALNPFPHSAGGEPGVEGRHEADLFIRISDGLLLLVRDNLDETYSWPGGRTLRFRGFTLIFGGTALPMNRGTLLSELESALGLDPPPPSPPQANRRGDGEGTDSTVPSPLPSPSDSGLALRAEREGIRLTVQDLRFVPDSAEILSEEMPRLDRIAEALRGIPDRTFLVEGHTASLGRSEGEIQLSTARARRIVEELIRRGIAADRFIYQGWGGLHPLGDNSTEAGRRVNRRVEITIL
jgi:outer membrane protein OmpA-like peptidoglycan-associated protein